jgi:hypothetical protein
MVWRSHQDIGFGTQKIKKNKGTERKLKDPRKSIAFKVPEGRLLHLEIGYIRF